MTGLATLGEAMLVAMDIEGVKRVSPPRCTCGVAEATIIADRDRHGIPVDVMMCTYCGTVRLSWQPAGGWLYSSGWYRRLHTQRGDEAERREWQARQWGEFQRASGLGKPVLPDDVYDITEDEWRLVEIGADTGGLCEAAVDDGWVTTAVEAGDEIPYGAAEYVMLHVLEHIPDCIGQLAHIRGRMSDRSRLWVAVPDLLRTHVGEDAQEYNRETLKLRSLAGCAGDLSRWWTIAHPWNWTARSIAYPFAHAGLHVESCRRVPEGTLATVGSILVEARVGPDAAEVARYVERNRRPA